MSSIELKPPVIKPECANCKFSYHLADDPQEEERCRLVGRFSEFEVNILAKKYIERTQSTELCEYHRATERLKSRISYD
jgi:hypothetical protein